MSDLQSRPYRPNPDACCERCVFKTGKHAQWCATRRPEMTFAALDRIIIRITPASVRLCDEPGTYPQPQSYIAL